MFGPYIRLREQARRVRVDFPSKKFDVSWPDAADYVSDETQPAAPVSEVYGLFHEVIMGQISKIAHTFDTMQQMSADTCTIGTACRTEAEELVRILSEFEQFGRTWREWIDSGCWDINDDDLLRRPAGRGVTER